MTCGSWASSSTSWPLVNHFFRWIATSWNRWMSRESTSQQTRLREPSTFHDFPQSFPQGTWNPWSRFVWRFLIILIYFDRLVCLAGFCRPWIDAVWCFLCPASPFHREAIWQQRLGEVIEAASNTLQKFMHIFAISLHLCCTLPCKRSKKFQHV